MDGLDIEVKNWEMTYSCNDTFYPPRNSPKTASQ